MKIKCLLGLHSYTDIGSQKANNVVCGFSETPIIRMVKKCKVCGKIKYIGLNISTNAHNDNTLNWQPIIKL